VPDRPPQFSLRYIGTSPEALDASELIQLLSAFASISAKAALAFYGSEPRTSFRIVHVARGSIDVRGFVEVLAGFQPAFAMLPSLSLNVSDVPGLIKGWLDLLKFLRGQPPTRVQTVTNGTAIEINNVQGDSQIINGNVYNTFVFSNVAKTQLSLQLHPIKPAESPIESEIDAILEVLAPVLEGDGVWRFKFGRMKLTAKLLDEGYRQKVLEGQESFRHGDRLRVRLKTVQERVGEKISTKHQITRVVERV
jgi:hypothetical protein